MNWLITTDLHLTDAPSESYRWRIFDFLQKQIKEEDKAVDIVVIAGDLTDRRDRHSSLLINSLVIELENLLKAGAKEVVILMGNHDASTAEPNYLDFLNSLPNVYYIQKPTLMHSVWFLPFSKNPLEDWKGIDLVRAKAAIMHQTISGAVVDGGRVLQTDTKLPDIACPLFSGDVHRPQEVGVVKYIGAPHPVRFGEDWLNRVIFVKEDRFRMFVSVSVFGIQRHILDIQSSTELPELDAGDQVKIRYRLTSYTLHSWTDEQEKIKQWATKNKVEVLSTEAILAGEGVQASSKDIASLELMSPEEIIRMYATEKQLESNVVNIGLELIKGD